jgi:hypothetical protein
MEAQGIHTVKNPKAFEAIDGNTLVHAQGAEQVVQTMAVSKDPAMTLSTGMPEPKYMKYVNEAEPDATRRFVARNNEQKLLNPTQNPLEARAFGDTVMYDRNHGLDIEGNPKPDAGSTTPPAARFHPEAVTSSTPPPEASSSRTPPSEPRRSQRLKNKGGAGRR